MNPYDDNRDPETRQREADAVDLYVHRRRRRALIAFGLGALGAGVVWLVLRMTDDARNPCERVRDHLCANDPQGRECGMFHAIAEDSVKEESPKMRSLLRAQCQTRIEKLGEEGVHVR